MANHASEFFVRPNKKFHSYCCSMMKFTAQTSGFVKNIVIVKRHRCSTSVCVDLAKMITLRVFNNKWPYFKYRKIDDYLTLNLTSQTQRREQQVFHSCEKH